MVTSPAVSWLFFKARAKRPYLSHTGRASNAEKQPTGPGPEGCVENGPAAALLVGYVSIQICALLAPCRRPILNATTSPLYARRYTSLELPYARQNFPPEQDHFIKFRPSGENELGHANPCVIDQGLSDLLIAANESHCGRPVSADRTGPKPRTQPLFFGERVGFADGN